MGFFNKIISLIPILRELLFPISITIREERGNNYVVKKDRANIKMFKIKGTNKKERRLDFLVTNHNPIKAPSDDCIEISKANMFLGIFNSAHIDYYKKDGEFFPIQFKEVKDKTSKFDVLNNNQRYEAIKNIGDISTSLEGKKKDNPYIIWTMGLLILYIISTITQLYIIYSYEARADNMATRFWDRIEEFAFDTFGSIESTGERLYESGEDVVEGVSNPDI